MSPAKIKHCVSTGEFIILLIFFAQYFLNLLFSTVLTLTNCVKKKMNLKNIYTAKRGVLNLDTCVNKKNFRHLNVLS